MGRFLPTPPPPQSQRTNPHPLFHVNQGPSSSRQQTKVKRERLFFLLVLFIGSVFFHFFFCFFRPHLVEATRFVRFLLRFRADSSWFEQVHRVLPLVLRAFSTVGSRCGGGVFFPRFSFFHGISCSWIIELNFERFSFVYFFLSLKVTTQKRDFPLPSV